MLTATATATATATSGLHKMDSDKKRQVRDMEKIKLVIIDDELISRNMIKKLIQDDEQYEIVADFADGKSAVEWLRCNEIDILLCDMQMPEMDDILEDKLYLGGNRLISAPIMKKISYGAGEIPASLWKQIEFEREDRGMAELSTLNEFFDVMEKERMPQKKVAENTLEMMRILHFENTPEYEKLLERIRGYEIFEMLREDVMDFMNREKVAAEKEHYRYSALVNQVIEFVGKNYQEDISLEICAAQLDSSYTHLSRAFKQETGVRFVEYLNRRRISRAKSLLIRGELPMKEVVEQSGFRNYNYFFKVFKELTGMKPGEFAAKI